MGQAPFFSSEDQEANHYLGVLRDGSRDEQILARDRLSHIFERRGMIEQAVELLESNAGDGVTDPRLFTTLATHYRSLGRPSDADAAMAHAAMLINRQQPAMTPPSSAMTPYQQPTLPVQPTPVQSYGQPGPASYGPQPVQVHVAPQMTTTNVIHNHVAMAGGNNHPPFIIRLIYFLLFGWYFGFVWISIALLLFLPIITFPLAIWMLNRTGYAFFL